MATNIKANHTTTLNIESFACFWLDENIHERDENRKTQRELRQVIHHLQTFNNSDDCERKIRQTKHELIILIVSGALGQKFIPRLHDLPQLLACYVFCYDKESTQLWAQKYSKIRGVFNNRVKLIIAIRTNECLRKMIEKEVSIAIISRSSQSPESHNPIYMWFQLLIEVVLRMHHKSTDREELIDILKEIYEEDDENMKIIKEFEANYKAENAIWWYTRESCFYQMLNRALRVKHYDLLFAFRFFITDIAKQLKKEHAKFVSKIYAKDLLRVYRGQAIRIDEFELIKKNIGEYLSMNSFVSTSLNPSVAIQFAQDSSIDNQHRRILFIIDIDPKIKTKAFADISKFSWSKTESEVLILLGALFRIEKVVENKQDQLWEWKVFLSLATDDDFHLKDIFADMKNKIGHDTDLDSLGKILIEMGEYEHAEECYERMISETQLTLGNAHLGLGRVHQKRKNYKESLEQFEKALKMQEVLDEDGEKVAESHSHLGNLHLEQRNYQQALTNLTKAAQIQEKTLGSKSLSLAQTYHWMANTYNEAGKHQQAFEYYTKSLNIRAPSLSRDHLDIAATYHSIGCLFTSRKDYGKALEYFKKALTIKQKILPSTHEDVVQTSQLMAQTKALFKK
ncbi:unnamed protein product [Rotaria sp. Silwood1]|nr:unnamed protein product [Rotaria sp. Silwood1]